MSVIITNQATTIEFLHSTGERTILDKDNLNLKESGTIIRKYVNISNSPGFIQTAENDVVKIHWSDVTSPSVTSNQELIDTILAYKAMTGVTLGDVRVIGDNGYVLDIEPNGSMPVTLQDQHTPVVINPFSTLEQQTTTTTPSVKNTYEITVASNTGIVAEKQLTIFNPTSVRFSIFRVVSLLGNVVTVNSPIDFDYPSGSFVDIAEREMSVDGSVTPVVYGIRNNAGAMPPPGLELSMDVTRLIITCLTATSPELDQFGNIAALTRGLVVRKRDGDIFNVFNVRTNGEIAGIMYDYSQIAGGFFGSAQPGFIARITWAGQEKMGVVQRLEINEDLEVIIQDDLTGIQSLRIVAEGSLVEP